MNEENEIKNNDESTLNDHVKIKTESFLASRGLLVVLSSNFLGMSFIINKPKVVIGRHPECDIIINDPAISKEHCAIILKDDHKFFIEDLNSTNFTYLNGKKIKKAEHIIYGDRIIIGSTILRFYIEEKID
jgi:pSer/pThr/pTyr-binding forkhead associated (FHA) protein